ncbi:MAG TPA: metallopeptidase family protein [Syntrophomonadaceae bacterium]|nr:metallopeptidase family protein [Syntrophomonadaceae bacterium]HOQ08494.1 metallopeptidase family protein [Syntrophomonadaceae bacterium]HPU48356.1 metallopeptidase family protein [Syntrophomonadaceae bacterium]
MAVFSIDQFAEWLEEAVERIPPHFCRGLTGGFNLQEEARREGDFWILGEYIEDEHLGRFIVFYYGSFVELLQDEPEEVWKEEIIDTVLHELQHHLELMAGRDDLGRREMEELAQALKDSGKS